MNNSKKIPLLIASTVMIVLVAAVALIIIAVNKRIAEVKSSMTVTTEEEIIISTPEETMEECSEESSREITTEVITTEEVTTESNTEAVEWSLAVNDLSDEEQINSYTIKKVTPYKVKIKKDGNGGNIRENCFKDAKIVKYEDGGEDVYTVIEELYNPLNEIWWYYITWHDEDGYYFGYIRNTRVEKYVPEKETTQVETTTETSSEGTKESSVNETIARTNSELYFRLIPGQDNSTNSISFKFYKNAYQTSQELLATKSICIYINNFKGCIGSTLYELDEQEKILHLHFAGVGDVQVHMDINYAGVKFTNWISNPECVSNCSYTCVANTVTEFESKKYRVYCDLIEEDFHVYSYQLSSLKDFTKAIGCQSSGYPSYIALDGSYMLVDECVRIDFPDATKAHDYNREKPVDFIITGYDNQSKRYIAVITDI